MSGVCIKILQINDSISQEININANVGIVVRYVPTEFHIGRCRCVLKCLSITQKDRIRNMSSTVEDPRLQTCATLIQGFT